MKKCVCAALLVCALLCGCGGNIKNDRRYMVSALGFESENGRLNVFAEIIIINSENPDTEPEAKVFKGSGNTTEEALDEISDLLTKPILLDHCGVLVIGRSITPDALSEICDYSFKENRITLSAYMVSSENAGELLSCEPQSSAAVGYDIMGLIEQTRQRTEKNCPCRYFEVEARRESGKNRFVLPSLRAENGGIKICGYFRFENDAAVGFDKTAEPRQ